MSKPTRATTPSATHWARAHCFTKAIDARSPKTANPNARNTSDLNTSMRMPTTRLPTCSRAMSGRMELVKSKKVLGMA